MFVHEFATVIELQEWLRVQLGDFTNLDDVVDWLEDYFSDGYKITVDSKTYDLLDCVGVLYMTNVPDVEQLTGNT